MKVKIALLTTACALALAACGNDSQPPAATTTTPAATPAQTTPAQTAPAQTAPAPTLPPAATPAPAGSTAADPAAAGADGKAAVVNDCKTEIEGNDAMQFNVNSIAVPASCTEFTITLNHVGKLPVEAMGHNVVISATSDMTAVAAEGMAAGLDAEYVKPDDARVIAHTEMIGGGETTTVTFPVSKIQDGGPYSFFCSFPGHAAIMKGTISVQ